MIIRNRKNPRWPLCIGEIRMKQIHEFNYLAGFITDDGKCDADI